MRGYGSDIHFLYLEAQALAKKQLSFKIISLRN